MKYAEASKGRVFVIVLGSDENIKKEIETFCSENGIVSAKVTLIGGVRSGSSFVSGPRLRDGKIIEPIEPVIFTTDAPMEFAGVGTVFPDEIGRPVLHLHGSLGRNGQSVTGCFRGQVYSWLTLEVILEELICKGPVRTSIPSLGVSALDIQ